MVAGDGTQDAGNLVATQVRSAPIRLSPGKAHPADPSLASRIFVPLIPAVAAFCLGEWQVGTRSYSQDEAATLSASRRPITALLRMLPHIDAVHGAYYLLIHFVIAVAGSSESVVRLPSVLATAAAAGMLAALGTRLSGRNLGLAAALLYAVAPPVTAAAQTARPFALAAALAIATCYRFVRFAESGRSRDAVWYGAILTVAGWCDILTALIVAANAVTLAYSPSFRLRIRPFLVTMIISGIILSPLSLLELTQVSQVSWESPLPLPAVFGLIAISVVAAFALRFARRRQQSPLPVTLVTLAVPWLVLPPTVLAITSQITPMWENRYLLVCLPAVMLLVIALITAALRGRYLNVVLAVAVVAMAAGQPLVRPAVAKDDLRGVADLVAEHSRPGDGVVFPPQPGELGRRLILAAYPAAFRRVRDVGRDNSPAYRDTLYGRNVATGVLDRRLTGIRRLWLIEFPNPAPPRWLGATRAPYPFCSERTWQLPGSTVTLYRRCAADPG